MLLIYTQKITPRIDYVFKHICARILGLDITITAVIEELIAHTGPKLSYGKQPMGNELFFQSEGLLLQQGFESQDITVKIWDDTVGFFGTSPKSALAFDIFSASFYLLTRYEEYLPHVKDEIGRFPASESLAFKENFLNRPVVDIWAYKFKTVLLEAYPDLNFPKKSLKIHSVVEAGQPYAYMQRGFLRSLSGYAMDLWKLKMRNIGKRTQVLVRLRKDPYNTFTWLVNTAKRSRSKLTVFFLLGDAVNFSESLNTQRRTFNMLVKFVSDYKEVGLIFSFEALASYDKLKKEKERMEITTNRTLTSTMNDQFLVNLPEIYRNLVELEVEKDFTMLYENVPGFRASTCTPFLFYDLDSEIKTPLIIHPVAMTTKAFDKKYESDIIKTFNGAYKSVVEVNGTFSMLFSNRDFSATERNKIWRSLFSENLQIHD
ncbi:DUF7033 domain-containing protein [Ulvibacter antarcticus]|uniref:DUF7033 domain-containing protein n=1 Tax=Ulvibacter antarcticus TaxID=442714 RepID=A0A3L9YDJ9_9FLAO|nr:hypothetical protein [Ulvibacter antarcticus]RMA57109.1 hypothetical protein BXY75_2991 [Ulvibacter antarcticus]